MTTNPYGDLSRTAAAIEAHDAEPDCWKQVTLAREVGVAYGLDTAEINDRSTCEACIRPGKPHPAHHPDEPFVRRMVRRWREHQ